MIILIFIVLSCLCGCGLVDRSCTQSLGPRDCDGEMKWALENPKQFRGKKEAGTEMSKKTVIPMGNPHKPQSVTLQCTLTLGVWVV